MIRGLRHKGLGGLLETGRSTRGRADLYERILVRLGALEEAENLADLNVLGLDTHRLHDRPDRYSIHADGPWCLVFDRIQAAHDRWHAEREQGDEVRKIPSHSRAA